MGVLLVEYAGQFYVHDVVRGQWDANRRNEIMLQTSARDRTSWSDYRIVVEQEPGSGGKESAEYTIRQLAGYRVFADRVTGDKAERAQPWAAQLAGSNVLLVSAELNQEFIDEHVAFPQGTYKNQVDAAAGAFNRLALGGARRLDRPLFMVTAEDEAAYRRALAAGEIQPILDDKYMPKRHWMDDI